MAKALEAVGIRGTIGTWGWDIGDGPYAAPAAEVLARQEAVVAGHPPGGLVEGWVTLVGHDLASDELLAGAAALAGGSAPGSRSTCRPRPPTRHAYLARTGRRPVAHLAALGVLGPRLLLAHAVWLDDAEVDAVLATRHRRRLVPVGLPPPRPGRDPAGRHHELVERGGRVALGTDAANAADLPDMLRTAALFAGLARDMTVDPERLGADTAFALATIGGAEAIGMGDRIGSLEPGKAADLVVHDGRHLAWTPPGDPALNLVWGTDGRQRPRRRRRRPDRGARRPLHHGRHRRAAPGGDRRQGPSARSSRHRRCPAAGGGDDLRRTIVIEELRC